MACAVRRSQRSAEGEQRSEALEGAQALGEALGGRSNWPGTGERCACALNGGGAQVGATSTTTGAGGPYISAERSSLVSAAGRECAGLPSGVAEPRVSSMKIWCTCAHATGPAMDGDAPACPHATDSSISNASRNEGARRMGDESRAMERGSGKFKATAGFTLKYLLKRPTL
jgi:hypothetical protein